MFKIVINGIIADLKGASKQELVFQNPMWDYEGMLGEYGLPFSLPFCPVNDRIFNNARSEFSATPAPTYICEQYLNDDLVAEGLIALLDTNGAYNIHFTSNIRDIFTPVSGSVRYDGYLRDILPAGPSVNPVANRNAMTTWNGIVCYPSILNDQFYAANAPGGWNNEVNSYSASSYQNTTFVPCVSVKYILGQIETYYGIDIFGDFMTDTAFDKLIIFHNTAEDGSTTANLKIAVGDIKVAEFINFLRNTFGLTGTIDLLNKKIQLDYCSKYFNAEVSADWSGICSKLSSKTASPYTGIELDYFIDEDDKKIKISTQFGKYSTANSKTNRLIKSSLCPAEYNPSSPFQNWMEQNGRTATNGQHNKAVKPRIAFYFGTFSVGGVVKPQYDWQVGTYSLRSTGVSITRNIKFASEETFWQNTFEASFMINLRKINLSGFDLKSKVHINGWNYLIKRIVMDCNNPEKSLLEAYRA